MVTADKNPNYSTKPGNDTWDKVYLLSVNEANEYFDNDDERKCQYTKYVAAEKFSYIVSGAFKDSCSWWLRSPGKSQYYAQSVDIYGNANNTYFYRVNNYLPVRPVLWIDLYSIQNYY